MVNREEILNLSIQEEILAFLKTRPKLSQGDSHLFVTKMTLFKDLKVSQIFGWVWPTLPLKSDYHPGSSCVYFFVCNVQFSSAVKAAIFSSFIKFCKCIFLSLETAIQGIANIMFECFYEQRLNKYILTNTYLRYFFQGIFRSGLRANLKF